jgi:uncharacterized membrane protein
MELLNSHLGLAGYLLEAMGAVIIVVGALVATGLFLAHCRSRGLLGAYQNLRLLLGRIILLGLEFLIAGDIIRTVVVHPTMENVAVLAVIVLVRTFLSMTIVVEVEGRWPWQQRNAAQPPAPPSGHG